MPPVGFEPTILVSEQPKTHALDRTATGIGRLNTDGGFIKMTMLQAWIYIQFYLSVA